MAARGTSQLEAVARGVRFLVRSLLRLAFVGALGAAAIVVLLARGGFSAGDAVLTVLLAAPAVVLVLFAQGLRELLSLPARVRDMPGDAQERIAELGRAAGDVRSSRARSLPLRLWRLRGALGSLRGVAGLALPLRVLTPQFLVLTALAAFVCVAIAAAGVVALLVLAAG